VRKRKRDLRKEDLFFKHECWKCRVRFGEEESKREMRSYLARRATIKPFAFLPNFRKCIPNNHLLTKLKTKLHG
jgi:hypothetical protein